MSAKKTRIAVAKGDGIGPEIMDAVLRIFEAAEVPATYEFVEMGRALFEQGHSTGMTDAAKATIEQTGILFKGPMETPKGKGIKSINVTARKVWNTYANVRKFRTFKGVDTVFSQAGIPINMTVLRENIEDTYGGVEYMHNYDVGVSYRFITRPGTEQFIRYAFEYAKRECINEITCGHKANIMKMTDGLFMNTFYEIAQEYPEIKANDLIVDDLAMKLVRFPDRFKIIVLSNLQGDIMSDLCAGLVGGLGFAPSANIGDNISIFEAVHGTAPDIMGKKIANPTSLLLSGIMMLRHIGYISYADRIENSLLYTLEQGTHTSDFGDSSTPALNTDEFADTIIKNLDKEPSETPSVHTKTADFAYNKPAQPLEQHMMCELPPAKEKLVGVDIFVSCDKQADEVARILYQSIPENLSLKLISNRGTQVWPGASNYTEIVDHYCCRLMAKEGAEAISRKDILTYTARLADDLLIEDIEFLKEWGDLKGFSMAQGQ